MLVIHATANLLDALGADPLSPIDIRTPDSLFGTWQGSVFEYRRKPYFAFMHTRTRLPLVFPATLPLESRDFKGHLAEHLLRAGISETIFEPELKTLTHMVFKKTEDRSLAAALASVIRELGSGSGPLPENGIFDPSHPVIHDSLWNRPILAFDARSPLQLLRFLIDGKELPAPPSKGKKSAAKAGTSTSRSHKPVKAASGAAPLTLIRSDGSQTVRKAKVEGQKRNLDEIIDILVEGYEENIAPGEVLREIMGESPDPGGDLVTILLTFPDDEVAEIAMMILFCSATERSIPTPVRNRIAGSVVPSLQQAMRDRKVADRRKLMIGPLLAKFGAPIPEEEYAACFQDFEGALQSMKPDIPPVEPTPACVDKLLDCTDLPLSPEEGSCPAEDPRWGFFSSIAHHTHEESPETAAMMIAVGAAGAVWHEAQMESLFSGMFHGIADSNIPEVRWQLETLGCWPFIGDLGAIATEAARGMQIRGVDVRHTLHREFSHGILSMVDGSGTRQMLLFFRTPEGGMDAVCALLRTGWGFKDAFILFEECDDLQDSVSDSALLQCPCTMELAREMFADALSAHIASGKRVPPRAFLARQYLGGDRLLPRPRTPNLGVYMLETLRRTPDLVADFEPMLEEEAFGGLWFHSDAAYAHVRANKKGVRTRIAKTWLDTFLCEVCIGEREALLQCMAINLEVEALAGRAKKPVNKMAARNYLAIAEEVVPFETIPYVRALAERAAHLIRRNLEDGHNSQAEANQAALDRDDQMHDLMDGLFWESPDGIVPF